MTVNLPILSFYNIEMLLRTVVKHLQVFLSHKIQFCKPVNTANIARISMQMMESFHKHIVSYYRMLNKLFAENLDFFAILMTVMQRGIARVL